MALFGNEEPNVEKREANQVKNGDKNSQEKIEKIPKSLVRVIEYLNKAADAHASIEQKKNLKGNEKAEFAQKETHMFVFDFDPFILDSPRDSSHQETEEHHGQVHS